MKNLQGKTTRNPSAETAAAQRRKGTTRTTQRPDESAQETTSKQRPKPRPTQPRAAAKAAAREEKTRPEGTDNQREADKRTTIRTPHKKKDAKPGRHGKQRKGGPRNEKGVPQTKAKNKFPL